MLSGGVQERGSVSILTRKLCKGAEVTERQGTLEAGNGRSFRVLLCFPVSKKKKRTVFDDVVSFETGRVQP